MEGARHWDEQGLSKARLCEVSRSSKAVAVVEVEQAKHYKYPLVSGAVCVRNVRVRIFNVIVVALSS